MSFEKRVLIQNILTNELNMNLPQSVVEIHWLSSKKKKFWRILTAITTSVFGHRLVLWHINHCRSFNAKSFLYIYIN